MNIKFISIGGDTTDQTQYTFAKRTVEVMLSNYLRPVKGDYLSNGIEDVLEIKRVEFKEFDIIITI